MDTTRPTILAAICTYRDIYGQTVGDLWNAVTHTNYNWGLMISDTVNIPQSRNKAVDAFLDTEDAEYLFFVDQDMTFTPEDVRTLVDAMVETPDAGAMSGFYIKRDGSMVPLCTWVEPDNPREILPDSEQIARLINGRGSLVESDLIPTGFMIIRKDVFKDIERPYFHINFVGEDMWSSDSEFCHKIREAGWKTYCHLGVEIGHLGQFAYRPQHFFQNADEYLKVAVRDEHKAKFREEFEPNSQEYWNGVWDIEDKLGIRRDYRELHSMIISNVPLGSEVVDFGCGVGQLLETLKEFRGIKETSCGLDISDIAVRKTRAKGFRGYIWDAKTEPLHEANIGRYDVAISTEVLEHIEDESNLIQAMKDSLKPGGIFVLSTPANCMGPNEEPEHVRTIDKEEMYSFVDDMEDAELFNIKHYWLMFARKPHESSIN